MAHTKGKWKPIKDPEKRETILFDFLAFIVEKGIDISDYTIFNEEEELIKEFMEWLDGTPEDDSQLDNQK